MLCAYTKLAFHLHHTGPKISTFLTLPNSDSGCALPEVPAGNMGNMENFVPLQWHGNTFVTFQRFHINTITT